MDFRKKAFVFLALGLAIGVLGCTKEQKAEAPNKSKSLRIWFPRRLRSQDQLVIKRGAGRP